MILLLANVALLVSGFRPGLSKPTTYDQRQSGDLNVEVHVKDLQVVALIDSELLDDYTDYDYFYDYADFTVKPPGKPTTGETTTVKPWATWPTNPPSSTLNDKEDNQANVTSLVEDQWSTTTTSPTLELPSSTNEDKEKNQNASASSSSPESTTIGSVDESTMKNNETANVTVKLRINDKTGNLFGEKDIIAAANNDDVSVGSMTLGRKRCKSGYLPDGKGRCRRTNRRRLSFVPLALQLTPKIVGPSQR